MSLFSSEQKNLRGYCKEFDRAFAELTRNAEKILKDNTASMSDDFNKNIKEPFDYLCDNFLSKEVSNQQFAPFLDSAKKVVKIAKNMADNLSMNDLLLLVDTVEKYLLKKGITNIVAVCLKILFALKPIHELIMLHRSKSPYFDLFCKGCTISGLTCEEFVSVIGGSINNITSTPNVIIKSIKTAKSTVVYLGKLILPAKSSSKLVGQFEMYLPYAEAAYSPDNTKGKVLRPYSLPYITNNGRFYHKRLNFAGNITYSDTENDEIVLAFRGTTLNNHGINWVTNVFQNVLGFSFVYYISVGLLGTLHESASGNCIKVVGHSLGGGLSQFSVAQVEKYFQSNKLQGCISCIGFNSAGLHKFLAKKLRTYSQNINHVYLQNDLVMNTGRQLGNTHLQNGRVRNPIKAHGIKKMRQYVGDSIVKSTYYRLP